MMSLGFLVRGGSSGTDSTVTFLAPAGIRGVGGRVLGWLWVLAATTVRGVRGIGVPRGATWGAERQGKQ